MKPRWRRLLQVNPSYSSSLRLGPKMLEGRRKARGTADGTTWAQGRPCCISSAEVQQPETRPDLRASHGR